MYHIIEIITIILGIIFLLWIIGFWIYISCEQAYRFEGKFKTYFHDINGYHIPDTKTNILMVGVLLRNVSIATKSLITIVI